MTTDTLSVEDKILDLSRKIKAGDDELQDLALNIQAAHEEIAALEAEYNRGCEALTRNVKVDLAPVKRRLDAAKDRLRGFESRAGAGSEQLKALRQEQSALFRERQELQLAVRIEQELAEIRKAEEDGERDQAAAYELQRRINTRINTLRQREWANDAVKHQAFEVAFRLSRKR
jgi:regulator of replication initiation timing